MSQSASTMVFVWGLSAACGKNVPRHTVQWIYYSLHVRKVITGGKKTSLDIRFATASRKLSVRVTFPTNLKEILKWNDQNNGTVCTTIRDRQSGGCYRWNDEHEPHPIKRNSHHRVFSPRMLFALLTEWPAQPAHDALDATDTSQYLHIVYLAFAHNLTDLHCSNKRKKYDGSLDNSSIAALLHIIYLAFAHNTISRQRSSGQKNRDDSLDISSMPWRQLKLIVGSYSCATEYVTWWNDTIY